MDTSIKVKDFIIDLKKHTVKKVEEPKQTAKQETVFSVVLQNDIDFVLNRKTKLTDKNLVFLVSQGLFYIKDNKTEVVENLNKDRLKKFFEYREYEIKTRLDKVEWIAKIATPYGFNADKLLNIMKDGDVQTLYKHHCFDENPSSVTKDLLKHNPKLFKYIYSKTNNAFVMGLAKDIDEKINYNNAVYFVDKITESNIEFSFYNERRYLGTGGYSYKFDEFFEIMDKYNMNFNRFIDYILIDLYSQGITRFGTDMFTLYRDYLDAQFKLYGKIKDKYPENLKTQHDISTLKWTIYQKHHKDLIIFDTSKKYEKLAYKSKEFSIILPKSSMDIVDEGINLSHCVAQYVDKVVNQETMILFLRETENIDKSLVTLEVKNNAIAQARGFGQRNPTEEENKFLQKWAKEKKLIYETNQ